MAGLSPGKEELVTAETKSAWLGSSSAGKVLGGLGGQRAEHKHAVALAATRANSILGYVSRSVAWCSKAAIATLHSILKAWAPNKRKILIRSSGWLRAGAFALRWMGTV